jgi:hypothetical protein
MSRKITIVTIVFISLIFASTFLTVGSVQAQVLLNSPNSGYKMTVSYQIIGGVGLTSPSAPKLTYFDINGISQTVELTSIPNLITMSKNKPWSVNPNPLIGSSLDERWFSTDTLSGTSKNSGSATTVFKFQHQYYLTVSSDHDTPSGSNWYNNGATAYAQLSKGTVQGTTGTRYVFTTWSGDGVSGINLKSNAITMDKAKTAIANWKTQYQITYSVNPAYSGSTAPSGTQYYNSGSSIEIKATSIANSFVAWTQIGTITIASPTASTTTAIINGPGKITANFATATQNPTHLTVQCIPAEIGLNQPTTIKGLLTDNNNHPIGGKTILLTWSPAANSLGWTYIYQATTDAKGYYEFTWALPTNIPVGSYFVMAQFGGDSTYRCNSAVASNGDSSLTVVPEYTLGALLALGACFASFLIFKKQNKLLNFRKL